MVTKSDFHRSQVVVCFLTTTILLHVTSAASAVNATFQLVSGQIADIDSGGDILFPDYLQRTTTQSAALDAFGGTTVATDISNDGTVIAGHGTTPTGQYYRGWIKQGSGPYVDLGTLGGDRAVVAGMSEDGEFVTGRSTNAQSQYQAFRWSQQSGMQPLDFLPHGQSMSSAGISADGKVIAGTVTVVDDSYDPGFVIDDCAGVCGPPIARYDQAFVWSESGGTVSLGSLFTPPPSNTHSGLPPRPYDTDVLSISADGKTVVGYTWGHQLSGFIWRAETGMQAIPGLPNQLGLFMPLAVSGDGSVVVGGIGGACGINCFSGPGAVIWDAQHGTRLLRDVLIDDYGLGDALANQFLEHASFISADGLTIAGFGDRTKNQGSWLVTLPAPVPEPGVLALITIATFTVSYRRRAHPDRDHIPIGALV